MAWTMTWLNKSEATLVAILQLLYIYIYIYIDIDEGIQIKSYFCQNPCYSID